MALSNLLSRAEDLEREAGRITMQLSAGDLEQVDYNNLRDAGKDLAEEVDLLLEDAEEEYDALPDKAREGHTGNRYEEFMGEIEDAQIRLEGANDLLRQLCTSAEPRSSSSINEVIITLEGLSDILTRAAKA